jgi:IclR family acetate operon transcriptional repressor
VVRSLVASGYLHREPDRRYRLGPRLVALGGVALEPVGPEVSAWLRHLVVATGETANAATLCSDDVMFLAQADSPHQMRASAQLHHRTMAHCSGLGRALLSQLPDSEVVALAARTGLPRRTDRRITSVEALRCQCRPRRSRSRSRSPVPAGD